MGSRLGQVMHRTLYHTHPTLGHPPCRDPRRGNPFTPCSHTCFPPGVPQPGGRDAGHRAGVRGPGFVPRPGGYAGRDHAVRSTTIWAVRHVQGILEEAPGGVAGRGAGTRGGAGGRIDRRDKDRAVRQPWRSGTRGEAKEQGRAGCQQLNSTGGSRHHIACARAQPTSSLPVRIMGHHLLLPSPGRQTHRHPF